MGALSRGHQSNRRSSLCPPPRVSMSQQRMAARKPSGFAALSPRSLATSLPPPHSLAITRLPLHSHMTTSTIHRPRTLMCTTIGSAGSLRRVLSDSFTAPLMCYDPEPYPQFSLNFPPFSTILFCALGHSFPTRSLTRRSDRRRIT